MGVKSCMNCKHGDIPEFNEPCVSCDHCSNWEDPAQQWTDGREAGHEWISVKDRLPECNTDILVFAHDGKNWWHRVAYLDTAGRWARNGGGTVRGVTHWMPLPEPPEEEA